MECPAEELDAGKEENQPLQTKEPLSEDVTECIGDCTAAVSKRALNEQDPIPIAALTTSKVIDEYQGKEKKSRRRTAEEPFKENANDKNTMTGIELINSLEDKNTMTDSLENSVTDFDLDLQRILDSYKSPTPPKCPDGPPLSDSESESEIAEASFAGVDVTSDFNLQHLKGMLKNTSPKNSPTDKEYSHLCFQCLCLPDNVLKDMENYAGIGRVEARRAAYTLMQYLKTPQGTTLINSMLSKEEKSQLAPVLPKRKLTKDEKLCLFLRRLTRQRGAWAVHEEDSVILPILANINYLVENLDTKLLKAALKRDQYKSVKNLVLYFEMEKRWSIRSDILGVFDLLASRDDCALSVLMITDLPVLLAFGIQHPHSDSDCILKNGSETDEKTTLYAGMLTSLLRSGDVMTSVNLDYLDVDFVLHLLGKIESYRNDRRDDPMSYVYMKLVLALNIQFASSEVFENPVISALSIMPKLTMFKYKLMTYLTQKEDALDAYRYESPPPHAHSSLKLLEDMLGCMHTTNVFNIDEVKFIFETLLYHVLDLDSGNPVRTAVLRNLRLLLCKLKYEHPKIRELVKIFRGILRETSPLSKQDKKYVQEMVNALSVYRLCTDVNTKFTTL